MVSAAVAAWSGEPASSLCFTGGQATGVWLEPSQLTKYQTRSQDPVLLQTTLH